MVLNVGIEPSSYSGLRAEVNSVSVVQCFQNLGRRRIGPGGGMNNPSMKKEKRGRQLRPQEKEPKGAEHPASPPLCFVVCERPSQANAAYRILARHLLAKWGYNLCSSCSCPQTRRETVAICHLIMIERIKVTELSTELASFTAGLHIFAARLKSRADDTRDEHAAALRLLDGRYTS